MVFLGSPDWAQVAPGPVRVFGDKNVTQDLPASGFAVFFHFSRGTTVTTVL